MKNILLIHGPNLNLLGQRDRSHYGNLTLKAIENLTAQQAKKLGYQLFTYQSNHEGDLIDTIQSYANKCVGMIINAGALSHYSYAIYDALVDAKKPIIEVHLSDIAQRESWRRNSVISPVCLHVISGKKEQGYIEAVQFMVEYLNRAKQ